MKTPYSQVLSIDSINFNYQYKHLSLTRTLGTGASTSLECVTGFLTDSVLRCEQHTVVTATEQTRRSLLSEDFGFAAWCHYVNTAYDHHSSATETVENCHYYCDVLELGPYDD